jgi:hypothetical protein
MTLTQVKQHKFSQAMQVLPRDMSQAKQRNPSKVPVTAAVARGVGCSIKDHHEFKEFLFVGSGQHHDAQLHQCVCVHTFLCGIL